MTDDITRNGAQRGVDEVYAAVLRKVLAGQLPLGSPLSRRGLAEELGVSTLLVGMAFEKLSAEDFIESRPRAGTRVKVPTKDELRGNYVIREALESQVARMFAEVATDEERASLRVRAEELDGLYTDIAAGADGAGRAEAAHVEFHTLLARSVRCTQLAREIERSRVLLFNWLYARNSDLTPLPDDWHRRLAAALTQAGADEAAAEMRRHVRFRMEEVIERVGDLAQDLPDGPRMSRGPQRNKAAPRTRRDPAEAGGA